MTRRTKGAPDKKPRTTSAAAPAPISIEALPLLLTPAEAAGLFRTTTDAIYKMVERNQLAGVVRPNGGRKMLFRRDELLRSIGVR